MALSNPWVTYLDRSYKSIKASIINRLKVLVPEITDYTESNLFVIIISIFAGLVEQLNYYIDQIAREMFITTARKYDSMIKLTRLIDYRVKAYLASSVDLKLTLVDSVGEPVAAPSNFNINQGIIVKNSNGTEYLTTTPVTIFAGTPFAYVPAKQRKLITSQSLGTTTSDANQLFLINDTYEHNSLSIVINSVSWELKDTLAMSGPQEKHFVVDVNEAKQIYVRFGDGINGAIPPATNPVLASYYQTLGENGNSDVDTITEFDVTTKPDTTGFSYDIEVTNPLAASGGLGVETLERIRVAAPMSIKTLGRAVTRQDHIDLAKLVPGVGKVGLEFDCAEALQLYIAPTTGEEASSALLDDVEAFFLDKKMIGLELVARPAGITQLVIGISATAKFRRNAASTSSDIQAALLDAYGFNNSSINKAIRRSDIIALVDNLDKVEYLTLDYIYTVPYPRRSVSTDTALTWVASVDSTSTAKASWRIVAITTTTFRVYRDDLYVGVATAGVQFSSNGLTFTITGTYTVNNEWLFSTYAYNSDITIDDYSVPVVSTSGLSITVTEQYQV